MAPYSFSILEKCKFQPEKVFMDISENNKCYFLLAEARKRQKMFFSHTAGGLGRAGREVRPLFVVASLWSDLCFFKCAFNCVYCEMPKESSQSTTKKSSSGALRRLAPYNKSPHERGREPAPTSDSEDERHSPRQSNSRKAEESRSRSRSPTEPPAWAKELLKQQKDNAAELRRLQAEIEHGRAPQKRERVPEPVFLLRGKQEAVRNSVVDKIDAALRRTTTTTGMQAMQP